MPRRHRPELTPGAAVSLIVVLVLMLLATIAAVSVVVLCTGGSSHCGLASLAVAALPARGPAWRAWWRRAQDWMLERRMRETERQIGQYLRLLADDQARLEQLREQLSAQQQQQLQLRSAP